MSKDITCRKTIGIIIHKLQIFGMRNICIIICRISENKYIEKSFIAHDDKIIEGLITFKTNDFIIPDEYNTKFNGFEVSLECIDDGQASTFTVKTFDFAVLKGMLALLHRIETLLDIYL